MGCIIHQWGKYPHQCTCQRCGTTRHSYPDQRKNQWNPYSHCECERCHHTNPDPSAHTIVRDHPDPKRRCHCLNCYTLFHDWEGKCQCSICGETRDEFHQWVNCRCELCGQPRMSGHVWVGCKCSHCGMINHTLHVWNGCTCKQCGHKRDSDHDWNGCTCTICGRVRNENHTWDQCHCIVCGRIHPTGSHNLVDCRCTNCNQEIHSYEFIREVTTRDESWNEYRCRDCGKETTEGYVGGM